MRLYHITYSFYNGNFYNGNFKAKDIDHAIKIAKQVLDLNEGGSAEIRCGRAVTYVEG